MAEWRWKLTRIAATGPRGRLGSELVRQGCIPLISDVLDWFALRVELGNIKPDVIIHCAAYTDVDGCQNAPRKASEVNTYGTFILSEAWGGKIIYISTDYIFDGRDGPYTEEAVPSPISIYGWSKLGGELVLRNRPNSLIVRTTVLFDDYSQNFVTSVIKRLLSGEAVTAPDSLYGSPTYVPHLAKGILAAVHLTGIINVAGNRVMSRLKFAQMIAEIVGRGTAQDGPIIGAAPRPLNAGLDVGKAQLLGLPIYDPLDGVTHALEAMAIR